MAVTIDGSAGVTTNAGGSVNPSTTIDGINYSCRAWVNFNGTGTVAIRASGNVSSITDHGVGDYTVNFSTAMSDANYAIATGSQYDNAGISNDAVFFWVARRSSAVSAGSVRVGSFQGGTSLDPIIATLSIFR